MQIRLHFNLHNKQYLQHPNSRNVILPAISHKYEVAGKWMLTFVARACVQVVTTISGATNIRVQTFDRET